MAKPDNNENFPEKQTWGTWEELLLACAVHRYGTGSWDSVAVEVQKRTSVLRSLSAAACRHKYLDLKRRFSLKAAGDDVAADFVAVPWLEELRKLRVAELRREVERYDLSISSLQLKVKTLEEERERSLKKEETEIENSDLDKIAEEKIARHREPESKSGETLTGHRNQSANELNSPDPKDDNPGTGPDDANREENKTQRVTGEPNRTGGGSKPPGGEDSCRGSCESVAKESAANSDRVDQGREAGDSPELFESMAESKGGAGRGEEEARETSDVQSSASLPRKGVEKRGEPDNEDQFPTVKEFPVESRPLADFLDIIQSKSFGSHFSRRLASQESTDYKKIIRQHIDLVIIRTRLEEGRYRGSICKFFRDLLLLVNNATLFYRKGTTEFKAAVQLSQLVKKEMAVKMPKQTSALKELASVPAPAKPVSEPLHTLSAKPRMSVPVIACKKRSSLAARSSELASGPDKKTATDKKAARITPAADQKPVSVVPEEDETSDKDDEPLISRKRMRERPSLSAKKVTNRNIKSRSNTDAGLNVGYTSKGRSSSESSESKKLDQEKKGNTSGSSKKQSVATFLKRMKGGTSSETGSLLEAAKTSSETDSSIGKRGAEQRKSASSNDKGAAGKSQSAQKRANGKKKINEKGSAAKKSSSHAPKRSIPPSSPLPVKRGMEPGEKEGGFSTRAKKRARR